MTRTVDVIGAGPGGLAAAMILSGRGIKVRMYEKNDRVGGRNAPLRVQGYTFDTGPTFLMMPEVLESIFALAGEKASDHLDFRRLDPLYRLRFGGSLDFLPRAGKDEMLREIEKVFPGEASRYLGFLQRETRKYQAILPCLNVPYERPWHYMRLRLLKALPNLDAFTSVYRRVSSYFRAEELRLSMTFQAKYLGMSPWECPATFTILPFIEHTQGLFHVMGGLNAISQAMAKVVRAHGGEIHLNTHVERVLTEGRRVRGLRLGDGREVATESLVVNADFAYAMHSLFDPSSRRKYTDARLETMKYSCSTFMLYLGLDRVYDIPHHNIVFADDYRRNLEDIAIRKVLSGDPSFYIHNPSRIDPSLAPPGHSSIYILVPVPNLTSDIDWDKEKNPFRNRVMAALEKKTELKDLTKHIVAEKVVTPKDWRDAYHVFNGATFNLAHTVDQMLYFRPHNRSDDFDNCYIVGGGTHPGSGLPTIYLSGKIAASLIEEDLGRPAV